MPLPSGPSLQQRSSRIARACAALIAALTIVVSPLAAGPAVATERQAPSMEWSWPLEPPRSPIKGFEAPATRYTAGHRGVDLAASIEIPVFASADGVVSFEGTVVDRPLVSISHGDGYITTVEPVTPLVETGDRVTRGSLIGRVAAGGHCGTRCLHVGVRVHGEYVSPYSLLGPIRPAVLMPLG